MGEKYCFYGPCFLDKEVKVMKKDLIRKAIGFRCFLTIEEIEVTDPKDRKECKMFEELKRFHHYQENCIEVYR